MPEKIQDKAPEFFQKQMVSPLVRRFAKGAFWSIVSAVLSRLFALLSSILVARICGQVVFGELGMIQSTIGMAGTFAGLGLGVASTKYVAKLRYGDPGKAGRIMALSFLVSIISASIVSFGLIAFSSRIATQVLHAPHLSLPLSISAGFIFFGALNGVQTGALSGFEEFQKIARISLIAGLSSFPLTLLGAWFWGVNGVVVGMVSSMFVNWWLNNRALRLACKEAKVPYIFRNCWSERTILWEFALPAAFSGYMTAPVMWYASYLLISRPNGYADMGIFSAAQQWQNVILFLPTSLAPTIISFMSRAHGEKNNDNFWGTIKLSFFVNATISGSAALCIGALSPFIMKAYGQSFVHGWLILSVLALTAIIVAVINVIGHVISSSDSMWWGFCLNLLWAIAFIFFSYTWVKPYGAIGLACSYLVSYLCHLIWTSIYFLNIKRKILDV